MAGKVLIHDTRVEGNTPHIGNERLRVNDKTSVSLIINHLGVYADKMKGISDLLIIAHGFEDSDGHGGYGIQFGKEGILLNNVAQWSALASRLKRIILHSCAVADVAPGRAGTVGDGNLLCGQLAFYTQTYVIASKNNQLYNRRLSLFHWREIDLGDWEGEVFMFGPTGTNIACVSNKAFLAKE